MTFSKRMLPALITLSLSISSYSWASDTTSSNNQKSVSVLAEQASPERLAKYRAAALQNMQCAPVSDEEELQALYQQLRTAKWDKAKMGCAAEYGATLADDGLFNFLSVEQQLTTLGTLIEYFDVLHKDYPTLYASPAITTELDLRWQQNIEAGQRIIDRLEPLWWWLTEFKLVSNAFKLSSTQHLTEHKAVIKQSQESLAVLSEIINEEPEALDAIGSLIVGQLLLQLPEFNGGDPLQAIEVLKQGIEIAPQNLTMHRWLIEAYVAEREPKLASSAVEQAALVSAAQQNPQDHSDTLKDLVGFALSLNQKELAQYLKYQRSLILKQNPMLNPRQEVASMGHGGADPITGRHADEI